MASMDLTDRKLLNIVQSRFPLAPEPYREIGEALDISEDAVLGHLEELRRQNVVRQISAIFDTRRLGYKTSLVAMAYDPESLHQGALAINEHPGVSHNYAREGSFYNLWFTVAVPPGDSIDETVEVMRQRTGARSCRIMPTIRFFKIGVNFDMVKGVSAAYQYSPDGYDGAARREDWNTPVALSEFDIRAIRELQEDLSMVSRPFDSMAERLGVSLPGLFDIAQEFLERRIMRRYSAVLHHRRAGFTHNGMGVWRVPSDQSEEVGMKMAAHPAVTHCYERPTFPDWPYTHFTMIHATSREGCEEVAREISGSTDISDYLMLYSTREYKKTRVRYFV